MSLPARLLNCSLLLALVGAVTAQEPSPSVVPASATAAATTPYLKPNPRIDAGAYQASVIEAMRQRETHRLSEEQFIAWSKKPSVIILDARSADKFAMLHVKGAINLPYPDIAVQSLNDMLPDKNATILIYCNNNFIGDERAMPTKSMAGSLNTPTYSTLYAYGYRNIYELGPLLDLKATKIAMEWKTPPNPQTVVLPAQVIRDAARHQEFKDLMNTDPTAPAPMH
ncbi:MAG: rhodanese-like domain-containing protein [Planctomycetota bacterium]